jgi:hypothetical protein
MFLSTFAHQTFCPIPCCRKQRRTLFIWSQSPDWISSPSFQSQGYKNTWPKSHRNLSKCTAIALKMLPDSCFKSCDSLNVEEHWDHPRARQFRQRRGRHKSKRVSPKRNCILVIFSFWKSRCTQRATAVCHKQGCTNRCGYLSSPPWRLIFVNSSHGPFFMSPV